ncbi:MAG: MjaI family restriction endonuclease, partial [Thermodesulfobacteriota bacterium]
MPKEWILNQANMRWGLTKKSRVGAVADLIRKCAPKELAEWEGYYYENGYKKGHLEDLGRKLFVKVSEVCRAEIEDVTEQDCIDFIINLVINRTFDGYRSEIQTIYG